MTTAQMKYFIEVARCLNFSDAAERLYISQPALSRHISSIENELNVQLFIRSRNTVRLTPAGQELLNRLDKLYADYCAMISEVEMVNTGATGRLNLGVLEYQYLPEIVANTLEQMMQLHPEIKLNLSTGSYSDLKERLYNNELDLIVTLALDVSEESQLAMLIFDQSPLHLVLPRNHIHAGLPKVSIEETGQIFSTERFLMMSPQDSEPAAQALKTDIQMMGIQPDIKYAQSAGQLALWLMARHGVTMLNRDHVLFHNPALKFIPIDKKSTDVALAWYRASCNPVITLFVQNLQKQIR